MNKFSVIDCGTHIYIKDDDGSYYSSIPDLFFDGVSAEKTYKENWYKLNTIPKSVSKRLPDKRVNVRYELKAGYKTSDLMPPVINMTSLSDTEYEEVAGLYDYKCDTEDQGLEELEFEINLIYKKNDFKWLKKKYNGNSSLLSQIEIHPDILQEFPQSLSSEQMYDVIRNFVKTNINNQVARITSDYDFHFEVQRKILIAEPYNYDVDLNSTNKRKKPNWVKKWVDSKQETIINLKRTPRDSSYGSNCIIPSAIYGSSAVDLENRVNEYLENLMKEINKQYQECPHCKGWGVTEVQNGQ